MPAALTAKSSPRNLRYAAAGSKRWAGHLNHPALMVDDFGWYLS